jgi:hypothetical protein
MITSSPARKISRPDDKLIADMLLLPVMAIALPVWHAFWIEAPGTPPEDYGVYHFRRTFDLQTKPEHFRVRVSGDNRYQLYVNGKLVSWGPARGDLTHWRYETVDLAPQVEVGKNALAAVVWNDGAEKSVAQISARSGGLCEL